MWHCFGPIFFVLFGLFLFFEAKVFTKEYHQEQDWKNIVWKGIFTRNIYCKEEYINHRFPLEMEKLQFWAFLRWEES